MRKVFSWTLLFVVLVIFGSGAVAFYTVFFRPDQEVVIPPLRERSVVEAVAEAERLGFAVQIEQVDSTLPEGRVLAQSPEPGTRARRNQTVVLQVSRSGDLHAVPDLRGQSLARAQAVIREQGFALGDVIRIDDGQSPPGVVIAQNPASPANISVARKIDLLVREGGTAVVDAGGEPGGKTVMVPEVNRKMEAEARSILEASGIKIQAVDRVYSPLLAEGTAIETRPGAGTAIRPGDGVSLKVATQRRPAGYSETTTESQGSVRKATLTPAQTPAQSQTQAQSGQPDTQPRDIVVSVKGEGDIVVSQPVASRPSASQPETSQPSQPSQPVVSQPAAQPVSGTKKARIRYQVPPLSAPMNLRIELTDTAGKRDVYNATVKGLQAVSVEAPYTQECLVAIYLGGDFVWQQRYK